MAKKTQKNMKNQKIEGACLVLTKRGVGTVTFVQPIPHGLVNYTAYGKTAKITADQVGTLVNEFKADKWEVTFRQEHIVKAPVEKTPEKTEAPVKTKVQKKASEEKPQTRKEAMTQKYGKDYGKRWNIIWNEEAAKVSEEVKKTGKRIPKAEWKKLMTERVKARLSA